MLERAHLIMASTHRLPSFLGSGPCSGCQVSIGQSRIELAFQVILAPLDFRDDGLVVLACHDFLEVQKRTMRACQKRSVVFRFATCGRDRGLELSDRGLTFAGARIEALGKRLIVDVRRCYRGA
jgi:hypothetical protein